VPRSRDEELILYLNLKLEEKNKNESHLRVWVKHPEFSLSVHAIYPNTFHENEFYADFHEEVMLSLFLSLFAHKKIHKSRVTSVGLYYQQLRACFLNQLLKWTSVNPLKIALPV